MSKHKFCPNCNDNVKAQKNEPRHMVHIILTILTCGIWFIIYGFLIIWYFAGAHYKCTVCGHGIKRAKSQEKIAVLQAKRAAKVAAKIKKI